MIFLYQMLLDEFGVFPVDDVYSFLLAGDTRVDSLKLPFDFVDDSTCSESLMIVSKTLIYMSLMMTAVFMFSLLTFFCYLSLVAFIRYKLRSKWTLFFHCTISNVLFICCYICHSREHQNECSLLFVYKSERWRFE